MLSVWVRVENESVLKRRDVRVRVLWMLVKGREERVFLKRETEGKGA